MFYRKSSEQVAIEGAFSLVGMCLRLFWFILIHVPFLGVGYLLAFFVSELFNFQTGVMFIILLIGGAIGSYKLVQHLEILYINLRSVGNKLWMIPKFFNLVFIGGYPFLLGFNSGQPTQGLPENLAIEVILVRIAFGLLLSVIVFKSVMKRMFNFTE